MQHHIWKQTNDDKIHFAPLQDPRRILDIGTGSGIWPIEMGAHSSFQRYISAFSSL
jgi:methylase of polypeptide subunit release factors